MQDTTDENTDSSTLSVLTIDGRVLDEGDAGNVELSLGQEMVAAVPLPDRPAQHGPWMGVLPRMPLGRAAFRGPTKPMGTDTEATENGQDIVMEAGFGIDAELERRVKQQATRFRTAYRRTVEEAWKLGQELRKAKEQVRHGQWIPWLEAEIGLTPRTAQRLMALNDAYAEMRHVSHLSSVSDALRALPSGSKSERSPDQDASVESKAAPDTDPASERGVAKSMQDLARVVERLESVVEAIPRVSARHPTLQFPVLCRALETIVSLMLQHANQAAADMADGVTKPEELVSSLDAALAKVREFNDSATERG